MLIRNNYLDNCILGKEKFSLSKFYNDSSIENPKYYFSFEEVKKIFNTLVKEYFKDDFKNYKKKSSSEIYMIAVLKGVDIYKQYLYIFAAIHPFKEYFVSVMLGEKEVSSLLTCTEQNPENLKYMVDKLTELGIYSD